MNDPFAALRGLRIGCVQYLNSKPLIAAYDGPVHFAHPSQLARELAAGELDVALVPAFEALRGGPYAAVHGVAIGSDGPVYSVFLAHRGPLAEVRSIKLDPASLTSAHLVQVLLREFHGLRPRIADDEADAELWIGNQAIEHRRRAAPDTQFLDLGEEWQRQTGWPFVFAMWALRAGLPRAGAIADGFRMLKEQGLALVPQIAAREDDPELAQRYLSQHIRFELGERERHGLGRYRDLLVRHGFLAAPSPLPEFI